MILLDDSHEVYNFTWDKLTKFMINKQNMWFFHSWSTKFEIFPFLTEKICVFLHPIDEIPDSKLNVLICNFYIMMWNWWVFYSRSTKFAIFSPTNEIDYLFEPVWQNLRFFLCLIDKIHDFPMSYQRNVCFF